MPLSPYYEHAGIAIYHGNSTEILPGLSDIGAVVTDPPYGIGWKPRKNHRGEDHIWKDDTPFDPAPWLAVGEHHLFFGAQYFSASLPESEAWLCWVKRPISATTDFGNRQGTYATIELAWTDFGCKPAFQCHVWDGGMRAGDKQNRSFCHPSQKPLEIMRWCVDKCPETTGPILDPYAGSGTTLRAAKDLGRKAIGIEIEEKYCEVAAKRLAQEVLF